MDSELKKTGTEAIEEPGTEISGELTQDKSLSRSLGERLSTGKFRVYWEYLEWLGLQKEQNLIVLQPGRHYFYDFEELQDVTTLLNLKHLNHIRKPEEFLKTVNQMLPHSSFFIGSFIDRKRQYSFFSNSVYPGVPVYGEIDPVENGIASRIPLLNIIYDFMDSRTNNRNMTRKSVTRMLEDSGFKLLDISEINGITCFCCKKVTATD